MDNRLNQSSPGWGQYFQARLGTARKSLGEIIQSRMSAYTNHAIWQDAENFIPKPVVPTDADDVRFLKNSLLALYNAEKAQIALLSAMQNYNQSQNALWAAGSIALGVKELVVHYNEIYKNLRDVIATAPTDIATSTKETLSTIFTSISGVDPFDLSMDSLTQAGQILFEKTKQISGQINEFAGLTPQGLIDPAQLYQTASTTAPVLNQQQQQEPLHHLLDLVRATTTTLAQTDTYHQEFSTLSIDKKGYYPISEADSTVFTRVKALHNMVFGMNQLLVGYRDKDIKVLYAGLKGLSDVKKINWSEMPEEMTKQYTEILEDIRNEFFSRAQAVSNAMQQFEVDHHLKPGAITDQFNEWFLQFETRLIDHSITIENPFLNTANLDNLLARRDEIDTELEGLPNESTNPGMQTKINDTKRLRLEIAEGLELVPVALENNTYLSAVIMLRERNLITLLNAVKHSAAHPGLNKAQKNRLIAIATRLSGVNAVDFTNAHHEAIAIANEPAKIQSMITDLFMKADKEEDRLLSRELAVQVVIGGFSSNTWNKDFKRALFYQTSDAELKQQSLQHARSDALTKLEMEGFFATYHRAQLGDVQAKQAMAIFQQLFKNNSLNENEMNESTLFKPEEIVNDLYKLYTQTSDRVSKKEIGMFMVKLAAYDDQKVFSRLLFTNPDYVAIMKSESLPANSALYYSALINSAILTVNAKDYAALVSDNSAFIANMHHALYANTSVLDYAKNPDQLIDLITDFSGKYIPPHSNASKEVANLFQAIVLADGPEGKEVRLKIMQNYTDSLARSDNKYLRLLRIAGKEEAYWGKMQIELKGVLDTVSNDYGAAINDMNVLLENNRIEPDLKDLLKVQQGVLKHEKSKLDKVKNTPPKSAQKELYAAYLNARADFNTYQKEARDPIVAYFTNKFAELGKPVPPKLTQVQTPLADLMAGYFYAKDQKSQVQNEHTQKILAPLTEIKSHLDTFNDKYSKGVRGAYIKVLEFLNVDTRKTKKAAFARNYSDKIDELLVNAQKNPENVEKLHAETTAFMSHFLQEHKQVYVDKKGRVDKKDMQDPRCEFRKCFNNLQEPLSALQNHLNELEKNKPPLSPPPEEAAEDNSMRPRRF